jgi:transposase
VLPAARRRLRATLAVEGRRLAIKVSESWHSCPIPEIARLGRTLRQWRQQVLAYFSTKGVSNGGTEAVNLLIEKTPERAHQDIDL